MDLYHLHSSWTHGLEGATMTTFAIKRPLEAMAFWSLMIMKVLHPSSGVDKKIVENWIYEPHLM